MTSPRNSQVMLPVGELVDPKPALRPEYHVMKGRYVTLEPLSVEKHSDSIYDDIEAHVDLIWTYLPGVPPVDREDFRRYLAEKTKSEEALFFAVVSNETGRALGFHILLRFDVNHRIIEVGVVNGPRLQRTRASTEAQYLLASYVFDELGYRRYVWTTRPQNEASTYAAARLGFTLEGVSRQCLIERGRSSDLAWFALLDKEWPKQKAALEAWLDPNNFDIQGRQIKKLDDFKC